MAFVCKNTTTIEIVELRHDDCIINKQMWAGSDHLRLIYQHSNCDIIHICVNIDHMFYD
jgi:hypothetical protein